MTSPTPRDRTNPYVGVRILRKLALLCVLTALFLSRRVKVNPLISVSVGITRLGGETLTDVAMATPMSDETRMEALMLKGKGRVSSR